MHARSLCSAQEHRPRCKLLANEVPPSPVPACFYAALSMLAPADSHYPAAVLSLGADSTIEFCGPTDESLKRPVTLHAGSLMVMQGPSATMARHRLLPVEGPVRHISIVLRNLYSFPQSKLSPLFIPQSTPSSPELQFRMD